MIAKQRKVMVKVLSCVRGMDEVKIDILWLVGDKTVKLQKEHFIALFGKLPAEQEGCQRHHPIPPMCPTSGF